METSPREGEDNRAQESPPCEKKREGTVVLDLWAAGAPEEGVPGPEWWG